MLEVEGLKKYFGDTRACDYLDFEIEDGELISLIGPNGSGKSTLVRLITGEMTPDEGKIIFKGEEIQGKSRDFISRNGISKSFQVVSIYPELTVEQVIRGGLFCSKEMNSTFFTNQSNTPIEDELDTILEMVELEDVRTAKCKVLSHGHRKYLDLALSLTTDPELLFLDEPTSGLKGTGKRSVVNLIKDLHEKHGKTVVFIEHDMDVVREISQRILVLHEGSLIAQGSSTEIQEDEQVRKVYLGEE